MMCCDQAASILQCSSSLPWGPCEKVVYSPYLSLIDYFHPGVLSRSMSASTNLDRSSFGSMGGCRETGMVLNRNMLLSVRNSDILLTAAFWGGGIDNEVMQAFPVSPLYSLHSEKVLQRTNHTIIKKGHNRWKHRTTQLSESGELNPYPRALKSCTLTSPPS
jgi:hypothetical protein